MEKKSTKILIAISLVMICYLILPISYAHNPEVVELEGTKIKFQFDTGDTMYGAKLIIQDDEGNVIKSTFVKEDGIFDYGDYVGKAAIILVNDGGGHMIEYEIPKESIKQESSKTSNTTEDVLQKKQNKESKVFSLDSLSFWTVLSVIVILLIIIFVKKIKKKK